MPLIATQATLWKWRVRRLDASELLCFVDKNTIVSNLAFVIYDCDPWIFGVVSSHMLTVRCYNLDVPYLEASIHSFFSNVNVYFEVRDDEGIMHYPKEWFTVPLNIIEEAIPLIVDKKIDSYRYDKNLQMIIQKGSSE